MLGPLGVTIVRETEVSYLQKRGQILKKEIFFKNIGDECELTVRPYKQSQGVQMMMQQ